MKSHSQNRIWIRCFFFFLTVFASCHTPEEKEFRLEPGDLLFQDLDCGELCDAIEVVTGDYKGKRFSHVGIVIHYSDSVVVLEAIGDQVDTTTINEFLDRNKDENGNPKVIVGRVMDEYKTLLPLALNHSLSLKGKPYDDEFLPSNNKYYCSEIIYESFNIANQNKPFFNLSPMTFKKPGSETFYPAWIEYYQSLKTDIPEGIAGCNPTGIANDPKINIVKSYY